MIRMLTQANGEERRHLRRRIREEAEAAMAASTVAATSAHVSLAACYANGFTQLG